MTGTADLGCAGFCVDVFCFAYEFSTKAAPLVFDLALVVLGLLFVSFASLDHANRSRNRRAARAENPPPVTRPDLDRDARTPGGLPVCAL